MEQSDKLFPIFSQFDKSAKQFCNNTNGDLCEITTEYKGEETPKNLKYRFAKIYYNSFSIEFKYTSHGLLGLTNSTLECLIYPDKSDASIGIPLPFAVDYFDFNTATPLCIPLISNSDGMAQAFECIGSVVVELLSNIEKTSYNDNEKDELTQLFLSELGFILEDNELYAFNIDESHYKYITLRFSSSPFTNFLKGKKSKSIKQLEKTKKLTSYEKRVLNIWKSEESFEIPNLSAIVQNAEAYNTVGVKKVDFKEFSTIFISWLILIIPISAVYVGAYFLLFFILSRQSVYYMGPIYNFPFCIIAAFVTSIAASYFTRFKFYKLFHRKSYEKYREMDSIENGGGSDRLMKIFLYILVIGSLVMIVLFSKNGINFKDNGFVDNSKFLSLRGEFYSYQEVDHIYYKPTRVNDFGDTLDFPSYVLVMKNGKEIDLYEYGGTEEFEEHLSDFLQDKGIAIESNK